MSHDPTEPAYETDPPDSLPAGPFNIPLEPSRPDLTDVINRQKSIRETIFSHPDFSEEERRQFVTTQGTSFVEYWGPEGGFGWTKRPGDLGQRDQKLAALGGSIVLDLGCGNNPGFFQEFIKPYGASVYIGVDAHLPYADRPHREVPDLGIVIPQEPSSPDDLPAVLINGDMLEVISRLPDSSVSVALNGLANTILPTGTSYTDRLADEVERVLAPYGLVFGVTPDFNILHQLSQRPGLKSLRLPAEGSNKLGFYFISKDPAGNT